MACVTHGDNFNHTIHVKFNYLWTIFVHFITYRYGSVHKPIQHLIQTCSLAARSILISQFSHIAYQKWPSLISIDIHFKCYQISRSLMMIRLVCNDYRVLGCQCFNLYEISVEHIDSVSWKWIVLMFHFFTLKSLTTKFMVGQKLRFWWNGSRKHLQMNVYVYTVHRVNEIFEDAFLFQIWL